MRIRVLSWDHLQGRRRYIFTFRLSLIKKLTHNKRIKQQTAYLFKSIQRATDIRSPREINVPQVSRTLSIRVH